MKTKYIKILYFILLSGVLVCCSDALDLEPDGRVTEDDIFSDNDKVSAYLNTCYEYIPTKGVRYYFWCRGPVEWSDEAWDTDAEAESWIMSGSMYDGDASASDHPILDISSDAGNGDYWNRYWSAIHYCSVFLSKIDDATVTDESDRERWTAEAHLLRAFYYAELLRWFGCALPIEREPYDYTGDFSSVQRSGYYEVVQFILEDCDEALSSNELPWRITSSSEAGRVTKALAEAIKSRMILYAASPLYNQGSDYWNEAYTVNKTCLENLIDEGYELYNTINYPATYQSDYAFFGPDGYEYSDYSALYNEYFTQSMAYSSAPVDKETIFQTTGSQGNIWNIDGIGIQDGYKSGTCPSQELVDAYETLDGETILDLSDPYADDEHTEPNYNSDNTMYDPEDPYENRDPRFYASIYYNGSKRKCYWNFDEVEKCVENYPASTGNRTRIIATWNGEPKSGISKTTRYMTRTGYYERKFLHPFCGSDNAVTGAYFKYFRLGEVYLNYAEAAAEAGYLDEAREAVNKIRNRVGMPELPTDLSQDELILRVHHERRVELAMEEARYFDVRRWSDTDDDLSETDQWVTAMDITRNDDGSFTYTRRPVRTTERKCYTNKYLWVPVPEDEVNLMYALTGENWQNPGW